MSEFVGLVIEVSPHFTISSSSEAFARLIEALLVRAPMRICPARTVEPSQVWCNAHSMCQRRGDLLRTAILHSSLDCANFVDARPKLVQALHDAAEEAAKEPSGTVVATAAAIGRALCAARKRPESASRVLVVKLGPDVAAQYNATMNCVFSAQRHGTVIDALVLSPRPSVLMQQAARLTKGTLVHLYESHRDQLATHLLSIFSASVACRAHLNMPPLDEADFRAACFCCTPPKTLESGWVCSSCLAIYCSSETRCRCYGDDAKPEPGADEASR